MPLFGGDQAERTYMPTYEVTVTLIVEHNGKPIVYTRTYLPQYKFMPVANMPSLNPTDITQMRPANYVPEVLAQQMTHIRDIRTWTRRTLQSNANGTRTVCGDPKYTCTNLIDGDVSTRWDVIWSDVNAYNTKYNRKSWAEDRSVYNSSKKCLFVEFKTNFPVSPFNYTLTTASNNSSNPNGRPKNWVLLGKKAESDPWTVLDVRETTSGSVSALPQGNLQEKEYFFNRTEPKGMKFFRFEVLDTYDNHSFCHMQLGEFRFGYTTSW